MVDFKKLLNRTPEEREKARKEQQMRFAAEEARIKLMIVKLYDQYQEGYIENEFACEFIQSVYARYITLGIPLTDKQLAKLEQLFEQY